MNNMTALVSCFARAYHRWANVVPVFDDTAAEALLGEDFRQIAQNMQQGAAFFRPGSSGTPEEALRRIVDGQLAPSVLARSAFCERALARETAQDCRQYVILAAGYDTFAMRNKEDRLAVFELDLPEVLEDKRIRIERAALSSGAKPIPCDLSESAWVKKLVSSGFHPAESAFFSLLGISYYLSEPDFRVAAAIRRTYCSSGLRTVSGLSDRRREPNRLRKPRAGAGRRRGDECALLALRDGGAFMRHRVSRAGASLRGGNDAAVFLRA